MLLVDIRAVLAPQVLDDVVISLDEDAGVMARHRRVIDHDGVVRKTPNRHVGIHGVLAQDAFVKFHNELCHDCALR